MEYSFNFSNGYGKRGASEDYFIKQIEKFYKCQIFKNPPINCQNIGFKFYPDIVLYFEKYNIAIAVEIDEPYTLIDGKPIHYYNNVDGIPVFSNEGVFTPSSENIFTSRTKEITNEGYILIRFAEEQVVLQSEACCKYIYDNVIRNLMLKISDTDFSKIQEIKRVKSWTYDEAKRMYSNRYRENYLKKTGNLIDGDDNSENNDLLF